MASDLPRVRLHDDGQLALRCPDGEWVGYDDHAADDPGWRDAVIVPLLDPTAETLRLGAVETGWHVPVPGSYFGVLCVTAYREPVGVQLSGPSHLTPDQARHLAASLLAAADCLDQAEAVNSDGH